ncbi:MAG: DUF4325 domain-containing protein [Clostridiales bacterium]|nr:DUF4325 domain-containing protein [Clostridiales bacterium]
MSLSKNKREEMQDAVIDQIHTLGDVNIKEIAQDFGITTKSVYAAIKKLEQEGRIAILKDRKKNQYELAKKEMRLSYELAGLDESMVLKKAFLFISEIPKTVYENFEYAFLEIMNNAIEHSNGTKAEVVIEKTERSIAFTIIDNGVGIFKKITAALQLWDERHAVLELAKGKFTTDPQSHSGEGIFFSSKVGDFFSIKSGGIAFYARENANNNELYHVINEETPDNEGTMVSFTINLNHSKTLSDVFARFTQSPEDYGFSKTCIPVKLLKPDEEDVTLMSRSQAKRLLSQVEKFVNVIFDFEGVRLIGQGFADEIFRVFHNAHPEVNLSYVNYNDEVLFMIKRAEQHKN